MSQKKYLLFIPSIGRYTSYDTTEELIIARDKLLAIELERLKENYKILEESFYANGDSETRAWRENKKRPYLEVALSEGHPIEILRDIHPLISKVEVI
jgi:hypothetical protein